MTQDETPQALTRFTNEIRRIWHKGEWYYSVVDIIAVLDLFHQPQYLLASAQESSEDRRL